jgi:hypothetical protein
MNIFFSSRKERKFININFENDKKDYKNVFLRYSKTQ